MVCTGRPRRKHIQHHAGERTFFVLSCLVGATLHVGTTLHSEKADIDDQLPPNNARFYGKGHTQGTALSRWTPFVELCRVLKTRLGNLSRWPAFTLDMQNNLTSVNDKNLTPEELRRLLLAEVRQLQEEVDLKTAKAIERYQQAKGRVQDDTAGYYRDDSLASLVLICLVNFAILSAMVGGVWALGACAGVQRLMELYAPRATAAPEVIETWEGDAWKLPPPLGPQIWSWPASAFKVNDEDFLSCCGLDAFVLCRIVQLGLRFCLLALLPSVPLMVMYWWEDSSRKAHRGANRLSLCNVGVGTPLLWAPVFAAYYLATLACVLLWQEQRVFTWAFRVYQNGLCRGRHPLMAALRTILVEDLPAELSSELALTKEFESLLGRGCVESVQLTVEGLYTPGVSTNSVPGSTIPSSPEALDCRRVSSAMLGQASQASKSALRVTKRMAFQGRRALGSISCMSCYSYERPESTSAFVTFADHATQLKAVQLALADGLVVSRGPYPSDVVWANAGRSRHKVQWRTAAVDALLVGGLLLWSVPVTAIQALASVRNLEMYIPLSLDEGTRAYVLLTQYLPVMAWLGLLHALQGVFWLVAEQYEGVKTYSEIQLRTMRRFWAYTLCTIYVTVLSGSVLDSLTSILESPRNIISFVGKSMPQVSVYFLSVVLSKALLSQPLGAIRFKALAAWAWRLCVDGRRSTLNQSMPWVVQPEDAFVVFNYSQGVTDLLLVFTICIMYAPLAPLVVPAGLLFLGMTLILYRFGALYSWRSPFQSQGSFFAFFVSRVAAVLPVAVLTLIAALAMLQGYRPAGALLPLLGGTLAFRNLVMDRLTSHTQIPLKVAQKLDQQAGSKRFIPSFGGSRYHQLPCVD